MSLILANKKLQIYKTINLINGKIYVGQDSYDRSDYYGSGKIIRQAIEKYGKENFKREIICTCSSKEELDEREIFWIKKLDTCNKNIGYNISSGVFGGANGPHSPNKRIGTRWKPGRKAHLQTQETKNKLKLIKTGHSWGHQTSKTKELMHQIAEGKPKTEKHKNSLKLAWEKRRKIIQVTLINPSGEEIFVEDLLRFCQNNVLSTGNIKKIINGERKHEKGWTVKHD